MLLKINEEKEIKFGPGYYKFNNSLLKDITFVTKMKKINKWEKEGTSKYCRWTNTLGFIKIWNSKLCNEIIKPKG